MSRRKPRGLRQDEAELWDRVRRQTTPLRLDVHHPVRKTVVATVQPANAPAARKHLPESPALVKFEIGQTSMSSALANSFGPNRYATSSSAPPQMDAKRFGKLKKGKLIPEGRIDLHGMTVAQAHPALSQFIHKSSVAGKRLVLVITGKGRDQVDAGIIQGRKGVLRHQVPTWLKSGPLGPLVLQITQSHIRHGGDGAYYVYLRRTR
jgi:DNA-nicking Smr family endonuclease